jgi:hypothetical protein
MTVFADDVAFGGDVVSCRTCQVGTAVSDSVSAAPQHRGNGVIQKLHSLPTRALSVMPHLLISVLLLLMHTFSWGAFVAVV